MNASERATGTLPGGYLDSDGAVHREVELTPLTGDEEELLVGRPGADTPELVTDVLHRCVRRLGSLGGCPPEVGRGLLVGDRQYLLLRLRALTFGPDVQGSLYCPWPDCSERVDVDFSIDDIPVRSADPISPTYGIDLAAGIAGDPLSVTFRLPNGADQEELGDLVDRHPAQALTALLGRCVVALDDTTDRITERVEGLSPRARRAVEEAMRERAPAVELDMDLTCPECGRGFTAPFDLQDFFFGELRTSQDLLYRQVHYLAYHYHWSERSILEMTRQKRLTYIDILADEMEALNDAV